MTVYNALPAALQRFRDLIEGAPTTTVHAIPAGTFRRGDLTVSLAQQQAGTFHQKPYEVVWLEEGIPDETGPEQVSGNLVDSSATVLVRVGYLHGVGKAVSVSDAAAVDARLIRRVLEEPGNYDGDNTGIVQVNRIRSRLGQPDGDGRVILEMQFRIRLREDQPQ